MAREVEIGCIVSCNIHEKRRRKTKQKTEKKARKESIRCKLPVKQIITLFTTRGRCTKKGWRQSIGEDDDGDNPIC